MMCMGNQFIINTVIFHKRTVIILIPCTYRIRLVLTFASTLMMNQKKTHQILLDLSLTHVNSQKGVLILTL